MCHQAIMFTEDRIDEVELKYLRDSKSFNSLTNLNQFSNDVD